MNLRYTICIASDIHRQSYRNEPTWATQDGAMERAKKLSREGVRLAVVQIDLSGRGARGASAIRAFAEDGKVRWAVPCKYELCDAPDYCSACACTGFVEDRSAY